MKGIDPIVGTILMVAVVVAAAVVVYYVVMNVVSTQGAQLEQQASQGQEKIVIEEVQDFSNGVGEPIVVYIRNLGEKTADVTQAYVLDKDNSIVCKKVGFDLLVKPMDINVLPIYRENVVLIGGGGIPSDCTTSSLHGTYTVKIVTANGTVAVKKVTLS